jgi:hypothetical protein
VQVFQRALEQNEPKKVFRQLVNIYVGSNKFEVSRSNFNFPTKKSSAIVILLFVAS